MEDFLATVLPRPADTGAFTPQIILCPLDFVVLKKFVLNIW